MDKSWRPDGNAGDAQKQPGSLLPHWATVVQHSPPLWVLQQQSTLATLLHLLMIESSPAACIARHRVLSEFESEAGWAVADE